MLLIIRSILLFCKLSFKNALCVGYFKSEANNNTYAMPNYSNGANTLKIAQ